MLRFVRAATAAALLLVTPAFAHNGVVHHHALNLSGLFTRATLPNAPVGGGFLTIENEGPDADRLVSATSPAAAEVQIHQMQMDGEVMRMRELPDGLALPPGQSMVLEPGGYHLMFMGLKGRFVEGETVPVTLVFEKSGPVDLELPVLAPAADAPMHMEHDQ